VLAIRLPSLPPRAGRTPPIRLTLGRNFSRFRYRNTKDEFDPKYVNYLITERGIPKSVQDELKARLLPSECTADINRIFIHTEGSVRAQPGVVARVP